jgi:di/tricarboxylate transporter
MTITFTILAITIALFIWGKPRADIVALLSLLALYLSGVITVGQSLSGFADSAVIMIAVLFVVGEGLTHTGITSWLGARMMAWSRGRPKPLLGWMMGFGAVVSGFMSNTAATAALMPAVVAAAWGVGSVPAKFLMPLSFAAITGGMLTLMGTPPNVVVAEALSGAGYAPFGFFDFAWVGLPLIFAVMIYMVTLGQRLLPEHTTGKKPLDLNTTLAELADAYSLHGKLFRLRILPTSPIAGKTIVAAALGHDREISVLRVDRAPTAHPTPGHNGEASAGHAESLAEKGTNGHHAQVAVAATLAPAPVLERRPRPIERLRGPEPVMLPRGDTLLQAGDILLVRATAEIIAQATAELDLTAEAVDEAAEPMSKTLLSREVGLAELLVTPRCELIGKRLSESRFADRYGVHVIGVRRHDQITKRQRVQLDFGDSLLVRGSWEAITRLAEDRRNFVVTGSPEALEAQVSSLSRQAWVALGAVTVMVALMVTSLVPNVVAALIALLIMVLGGAVPVDQIYKAISWQSLVLIAGMIPMSIALQVSGGAAYLVNLLVTGLGSGSPLILLAGVFLITSALSQVISNTATTVLVAPLILQTALSLGISPYPMLMMVAVGASTAFLTPIGTPTNLLVMAPGGYQFRHYTIVGLPIFFVFLGVALLIIPWVWPL